MLNKLIIGGLIRKEAREKRVGRKSLGVGWGTTCGGYGVRGDAGVTIQGN